MTEKMLSADYLAELVVPYQTRTWVSQPERTPSGVMRTRRRAHVVQHLGLLDQVEETISGSTMGHEEFSGGVAASKPAARLECIDYIARVNRESAALAVKMDLMYLPLRPRLLGMSDQLAVAVARDWWSAARIITQHDAAPVSPNVPCGNSSCDRRQSMRLRLEDRIAVCVECHSVWSDDAEDESMTFGRLTLWIQWAAMHLNGPACPECIPEREQMAIRAKTRYTRPIGTATPGVGDT